MVNSNLQEITLVFLIFMKVQGSLSIDQGFHGHSKDLSLIKNFKEGITLNYLSIKLFGINDYDDGMID